MKPVNADCCVYISTRGEDCLIVVTYVDDMLLASRSLNWISEFKQELRNHFEIKDLGNVTRCLGMEFKQTESSIEISQKIYIREILKRFNMTDSKPVSTPISLGTKLIKSEECGENQNSFPFRELVGALMYLAVSTRPDIAYSVNWLSQFNNSFGKEHWIAAKRILRYLQGRMDLGLKFEKTEESLKGYADADWGNCPVDGRSYTGYVFTLANASISWEARKQRSVALSSTQAEYMAMSEATKEAIFLKNFLKELHFEMPNPIKMFNDNQGAHLLAKNPVFHNRTKHIALRHHFVREALSDGFIDLEYLQTSEMIADVLTKGLPGPLHRKCINGLGLVQIK